MDANASAPAADSALYNNLIPILSKVTGRNASDKAPPQLRDYPPGAGMGHLAHAEGDLQRASPRFFEAPREGQLEVVQEAPGVASTSSSTAAALRRGWTPTKSLRVPALRGNSNVQALDLSQIRLPPLGGPYSFGNRSFLPREL